MKKNYKRIISVLLAITLLAGVFTACSKTEDKKEESTTVATQETTEATTQKPTEKAEEVTEETTQKAEKELENHKANTPSATPTTTTVPSTYISTADDNYYHKKKEYVEAKNFRVVTYLVANESLNSYANLDKSHFDQLTDIIVFGIAGFSEDGKVWTDKNFSKRLNNIKKAVKATKSKARIHINLLGPGSQSSSDVWEDQMRDQAMRHSNAFATKKLETNILNLLKKYDLDGVFFDYEYPLEQEYWNDFDAFLVSLDAKLGSKYILGAAISPWNTKQTKAGMDALDMIEVMSYDTWDDDGNHATVKQSKSDIIQMIIKGYDIKKLDLGIPFYGRPTNHGGYWYGYNGDVDEMDENGLCYDKNTGLTFSYNTPSMVYEKTKWAIDKGLAGVMIWHYACDAPKSHSKSLFNAIETAKKGMPLK